MLRGPKIVSRRICSSIYPRHNSRRFASPCESNFTELAGAASSKYQIYLSTSDDPYLNLSIEHHLLQTTPPDSTILFLYANRPCVVIGRNQNPWLETNLKDLSLPRALSSSPSHGSHTADLQAIPSYVELVRRRSGGGTVFHGPGNVNYSVICPSEIFTRDKHAWMIARALQTMNASARVNARHDIVISAFEDLQARRVPEMLPSEASPTDPSATALDAADAALPRKVSGSAYKLTRGRALHHGTCLLCTPHLQSLSIFLSSPARGYLDARGVDSVRSHVANVLPPANDTESLSRDVDQFHGAVLRAFADLYPAASLSRPDIQSILEATAHSNDLQADGRSAEQDAEMLTLHQNTIGGVLNGGLANLSSIQNGMAELRSTAWLFGQTPRFTLSTLGMAKADGALNATPVAESEGDSSCPRPSGMHVFLGARNGVVTGIAIVKDQEVDPKDPDALRKRLEAEAETNNPQASSLNAILRGRHIHSIDEREWDDVLAKIELVSVLGKDGIAPKEKTAPWPSQNSRQQLREWLRRMLPLPHESA